MPSQSFDRSIAKRACQKPPRGKYPSSRDGITLINYPVSSLPSRHHLTYKLPALVWPMLIKVTITSRSLETGTPCSRSWNKMHDTAFWSYAPRKWDVVMYARVCVCVCMYFVSVYAHSLGGREKHHHIIDRLIGARGKSSRVRLRIYMLTHT